MVHGGNDLEQLNIKDEELVENGVTILDTALFFSLTSADQPISLVKLCNFFDIKFLDRDNKKSLIQGHSAERDSRATLKIFKRAMALVNEIGYKPSRAEIETSIADNKTYIEWKLEEITRNQQLQMENN